MLHPRCCTLKGGRLTEEGTEEEVVCNGGRYCITEKNIRLWLRLNG